MTNTITPPTESRFDADSQHIGKRQYSVKGEAIPEQIFARVANWVAGAEKPKERKHWAQKYYDLMAEKKFCPGGRVLAGAGTSHGNVLNCFVQGATEHAPSSFEGVMEVARKLALVTKVGGGNGVNLDVYEPHNRLPETDVRGVAYMSAEHPDVQDFILGLMRPPTQPDGDKQPIALKNWDRVVYGPYDHAHHAVIRTAVLHNIDYVPTEQLPADVVRVTDDMNGIIDAATIVAAKGKTGETPRLDLSSMRAEGTPIKGSGGTSSGPVSFLFEIYDNFLQWGKLGGEQAGPISTLRFVYAPVLRVVRQGGTRRGAGMATISIGNPDVLDFLTAKDLDREKSEGDISTFNISILVTQKFWETLQQGALWPINVHAVPGKYYLAVQDDAFAGIVPTLNVNADDEVPVPVYRIEETETEEFGPTRYGVPAQWLWTQIAQHAWSTGEPGLIFNDRVNEFSALKNLGERYEIRSTNPLTLAA